MPYTVEQIIEKVGDLVSLPEVCVRVNALIDDPNSTISDVSKVISQDPGMTARMLRIANSAFYGLSYKVDTVDKAATIIGMSKIRELVLATSVAKTLPNDIFTMHAFWKHSIYCGLAAKALSLAIKKGQADALFIAGLLHDVGQLVMFHVIREETSEALMASVEEPDEPPIDEVERRMIGFDHCQLGSALASKWQLPDLLCDCIAFHHQPGLAERNQDEVAIIHMADTLAHLAEIRSEELDDAPPISPEVIEAFGLTEDSLLEIVASLQEDFSEVQTLLFGTE